MGTGLVIALAALGVLAVGVLIGRYYVPDDRALKRSARHADAYMRAIDHLLARDRDGAIDELRSVVAENVSAIEPYFALAALFRSRGEWERAIRVHQAIYLRADSSREDKLRARYQLGLDFRAAGMPRRATRALEDCLESDPKHLGARRALCGLYEEQGRFAEAAEMWSALRRQTDEGSQREAHLLAAAAQRALEVDNVDAARDAVKRAAKLDDQNPHVWAASAEVEAASGNPEAAAEQLVRALALAPEWAIYLVPGLLEAELQKLAGDAWREPGDDDLSMRARAAERAVAALETLREQNGNNPFLMLATAELRSYYDSEAALANYREVAGLFSDLLPARIAAGRLALAADDPDEIRDELVSLVTPEGALAWATEGAWRCAECGVREPRFYWRCPSCRQWGTARLDLGRAAADEPVRAARERRRRPRSRVLWKAEDRALPAASVGGDTSPEEAAEQMRSGLLGRARSWLSTAFRRSDE